jgi:hypothetical protein
MASYRLLVPLPLEVQLQRVRYRLAARQDAVSCEWRVLAAFSPSGEWLITTANSPDDLRTKLYEIGIERYPGSIPDRILRELGRLGMAERVGWRRANPPERFRLLREMQEASRPAAFPSERPKERR